MPKLHLTDNALTTLKARYLLTDDQGKYESPEDLFERVARAVASVEKKNRAKWQNAFLEMMLALRFLPNSPTLMNAGKKQGQLSACFVLPVEDSLEGIFDSLKNAAKIHQSGGGTGFSFSRLRPEGAFVRSSQGVASGPVSFMKIFDVTTETIKQGGTRRGANMAILSVNHPDILQFIESKLDMKSITNFNISVGVTDPFMRAVERDTNFDLVDPRSGKVTSQVKARMLFSRMTECAWKCGDPGLVFLDRIDFFNPTPKAGVMESTNPCGEQPLLPFESCNLGSLNLSAYFRKQGFDWELFRRDIQTAVRFLDNVIDANFYPVDESRKITLKNRKIGLGVMGFADLLLEMKIPYSSNSAREMGEKFMGFMDREAKASSMNLAKERGAFPNWKGSLWDTLGYTKLRNSTVSTVAPTGTISLIAGVSSGIEPIFSAVFYRNVLAGNRLKDVHPKIAQLLRAHNVDIEKATEDEIGAKLGAYWTPAQTLSISDHVKMQAAFQRHSDSAVSKTINLSRDARVEDVWAAYQLAFAEGCKGITVYRDQSRPMQVLEKAAACPDC